MKVLEMHWQELKAKATTLDIQLAGIEGTEHALAGIEGTPHSLACIESIEDALTGMNGTVYALPGWLKEQDMH